MLQGLAGLSGDTSQRVGGTRGDTLLVSRLGVSPAGPAPRVVLSVPARPGTGLQTPVSERQQSQVPRKASLLRNPGSSNNHPCDRRACKRDGKLRCQVYGDDWHHPTDSVASRPAGGGAALVTVGLTPSCPHRHRQRGLEGSRSSGAGQPELLLGARTGRGLVHHEQMDKDPPTGTAVLVWLVLGSLRGTQKQKR